MKSQQRLRWLSAVAASRRWRSAPATPPRRRPNCWSTRRSRPTRSRPTRRRSTRRIPTSTLKWVRDSTGVITAKVLAEKANPQADIVIGRSASSMAVFANEGMLAAVRAEGLRQDLRAQYRDSQNPPRWVGMDVYGAAICFNTVEAQKQDLPKPETWKDLTKPVYKGQIVDAESGVVGHRLSSTSPAGCRCGARPTRWKFMDALHENIAQYTHSGSQAVQARRARASSRSASRSSTARSTTKKSGAPVDVDLPERRAGLGPRGDRHHEDARRSSTRRRS